MAEDKKKVIVYADWISKFEALEDAEAGKLIKHFFRYINDLNPKYPDRITEISFIDIQNTLKRDLIKWEKRAEKSRENGMSGGRPKNLIKPKETNQVILEPTKPVSVSVSDSVNGSVSDIVKKEIINIPPIQEFLDYCKTIKEINFKQYEFSLKTKYETWVDDKWKDGNGNKIKNWKTKIKSVIPYLKPTEQKQESHNPNGHIKPI
mgnify:FL=1